jgi:hypothetical protein
VWRAIISSSLVGITQAVVRLASGADARAVGWRWRSASSSIPSQAARGRRARDEGIVFADAAR